MRFEIVAAFAIGALLPVLDGLGLDLRTDDQQFPGAD